MGQSLGERLFRMAMDRTHRCRLLIRKTLFRCSGHVPIGTGLKQRFHERKDRGTGRIRQARGPNPTTASSCISASSCCLTPNRYRNRDRPSNLNQSRCKSRKSISLKGRRPDPSRPPRPPRPETPSQPNHRLKNNPYIHLLQKERQPWPCRALFEWAGRSFLKGLRSI